MPRIVHQVDVRASCEAVYQYIEHTYCQITGVPLTLGSLGRYSYLIAGIRIKGEHEVIELTPNAYLLLRTLSGLEAILEIMLDEADGGCTLQVTADYALPGAMLGGATNRPALEEQVTQAAHSALSRLKTAIETQGQS